MATVSEIEIEVPGRKTRNFENVSINESIYGIDTFSISYRFDAIEKQDGFLIENSKEYLGLPITIKVRANERDQKKEGVLFKGFITEIQGSKSDMANYDRVVISGGSMEIQMNGKPVCRAFENKKLEEIVTEVMNSYTFSCKVKPRDNFNYPYIVQYQESDLEFLKRLSIRYGEWFFFNGSDMIFGEIPKSQQELIIGYDLQNFSYQLKVSPVKFTLLSQDPLNSNMPSFKAGSGKAEKNLNIYGNMH
jgi:uncharacterized protein involved in type VI secretion and phage assembly